jgi:hypothetical protein
VIGVVSAVLGLFRDPRAARPAAWDYDTRHPLP